MNALKSAAIAILPYVCYVKSEDMSEMHLSKFSSETINFKLHPQAPKVSTHELII
jgi:hypothetical protein